MDSSDDNDFLPEKKKLPHIGLQPDDKKKRGRPKGSKNKVSSKSSSKRKTIAHATDVKDIDDPCQQRPVTHKLPPKIVLKINVSKGTVKAGGESNSTKAAVLPEQLHNRRESEVKICSKTGLDMLKLTDTIPTSEKLSLPLPLAPVRASCVLPENGVKRILCFSSSDSDNFSSNENLATKWRRSRSKLSKSFVSSDSKGMLSTALCDSGVSTVGESDELARRAERLHKRFARLTKSPKKMKKKRVRYYTLKPEVADDNSARSSGSSSDSDDYNAWMRTTMTYPTDVVSKQMDLPDSSPEKGKRLPSLSPSTSPEGTTPKSHTRRRIKDSNLWPLCNVNNPNLAPAKPPKAVSDKMFRTVVDDFFRDFASASQPSSFKDLKGMPARFPVVHEPNCCVEWRERSAARGKQPAGRGRRKRKGVCTGYLACPCQDGAGPSSAAAVLPSFHDVSPLNATGFTPATCTKPAMDAATTLATLASSGLDKDIVKLANEALVADSRLRPHKVLTIMDISDDSDGGKKPFKVTTRLDSPLPEKEIKSENTPSLCFKRRDSGSSNSSDVEFVPGPPIEEIVVSDESNDIIFVSETASPNKASAAASTPKKDEVSGISTESADIIFDFALKPTPTSPHSNFLRRKLPNSPLGDSTSNNGLNAGAEILPNPICALPPPATFATSFDTTLESLYPVYSKNAGRTPEPLDFDALLDFEAESMTPQNYEPYSPCLPDSDLIPNDYDQGDEIINIGSPEQPAPESVPEKADGLVVWECPVCFEPKGDETILATTDCTHLFCDPCIRKVATMYGKCPVCQCPIKESNIHPFRFHGYKF